MPASRAYALSATQRRIWDLCTRAGTSPFTMQGTFRITGPIDTTELREALDAVVARSEVLRTTLHRPDDLTVPLQVVHDRLPVDWALVEATDPAGGELLESHVPDQGPGAGGALPGALAEHDEDASPSLSVRLMPLGGAEHRLVLTLPGVLADRASASLLAVALASELDSRWHARLATDGVAEDEAAPLQFIDIAQWQSDLLDGVEGEASDREAGLAFWAAIDPARSLRPEGYIGYLAARTGYRPARVSKPISAQLLASLQHFAPASHRDPIATYLAAWQALHRRLASEHSDGVLGLVDAGRSHHELADALGPLAAVVPIASQMREGDSLESLYGRVADQLADVRDWRDYFDPARLARLGVDYLPVGFEFESGCATLRGGPVSLEPCEVTGCTDRFDLLLRVTDAPASVIVTVEFDAGRISEDSAQRLLDQYLALLGGALESSSRPLREIDILPDAQRRRLIEHTSSGPALTHADDVAMLFERQAAATPNAEAVRAHNARLTYGELDRAAERLAERLAARGLGPGDLVAVHLEQSPSLLVGMLGVLKAGAAYVPLDPSYPALRRQEILDDSGASLLVCGDQVDLPTDLPILRIGTVGTIGGRLADTGGAVSGSARDPARHADAVKSSARPTDETDLAYVLYTSGSTGRPKGVAITRRNLATSIGARLALYGPKPPRFLLLSSHAFDSSVAGLYWPLCTGGTVVLPGPHTAGDAVAIAELIQSERITHTLCLPSLYAYVLEQAYRGGLSTLDTVIVAGEVLPPQVVRTHHQTLAGARLFNEYGPTEGTVWCCAYDCSGLERDAPVPIGRPIAGASLFVLDATLRPVPAGAPGELYLGGPGVASGYHRAPDLTDERFVPNPFGAGVLYQTGDRARYLDDDNLEFLGRVDDQIKIRGFRVEPAEVEACLRRTPGVLDAVVIPLRREAQAPADHEPRTLTAALEKLPTAVAEALIERATAGVDEGIVR